MSRRLKARAAVCGNDHDQARREDMQTKEDLETKTGRVAN
jgi:hypothetical protein